MSGDDDWSWLDQDKWIVRTSPKVDASVVTVPPGRRVVLQAMAGIEDGSLPPFIEVRCDALRGRPVLEAVDSDESGDDSWVVKVSRRHAQSGRMGECAVRLGPATRRKHRRWRMFGRREGLLEVGAVIAGAVAGAVAVLLLVERIQPFLPLPIGGLIALQGAAGGLALLATALTFWRSYIS